jgi:hypothetical protein
VYLFIISLQQTVPRDKPDLKTFIGILVSAAIVLLDLLFTKATSVFVSFEKHFSSVGRNWKRISYFSIFIILNSTAVIVAYCFGAPILQLTNFLNDTGVEKWQKNTYARSYDEWFQSCSGSQDIVHSFRHNVDAKTIVGYWHYFASQKIDVYRVPSFAYDSASEKNYGIGCNYGLICFNGSRQSYPLVRFADSCAFISSIMSSVADGRIPKIVFTSAVYDLPWPPSPNLPAFRLSSFAAEGSLYGFLFAFMFIKSIRLAIYYIYKDLTSILSHRLLMPVLKRLGYNPDVRHII